MNKFKLALLVFLLGIRLPVAFASTITLDGVNDFSAADTYATTTSGHNAYISRDENNLYLGYSGSALAAYTSTEWAMFFIDVNPGTGSSTGETINTQTPVMPGAMTADYIYRYKFDNSYQDVRAYDGTAWTASSIATASGRSDDYVEAAISLADLGSPTTIRITSLLLNEAAWGEWSYGGLFADNFVDGYYPSLTLTRYLDIDLTANAVPEPASLLLLALTLFGLAVMRRLVPSLRPVNRRPL